MCTARQKLIKSGVGSSYSRGNCLKVHHNHAKGLYHLLQVIRKQSHFQLSINAFFTHKIYAKERTGNLVGEPGHEGVASLQHSYIFSILLS